jgi:four helix bundle protein
MMASDLKERTRDFALRIIRLYSALPKNAVADVVGRQLLRAGTSVGANYREAQRSRSRAELATKVDIALMELEETGYWLELLERSELIQAKRLESLHIELGELTAILTTIAKKNKAK